jgi:DMSO/TMAO reductase YedYZ molybdopterin-dependent catalytic subunit
MKKGQLFWIAVSLLLVANLAWAFAAPAPTLASDVSAASNGTTSITVTKYAADGVTIIDQAILTYQEMEAQLPVQGDGTTQYYFQGPTFQPENLWDPAETVNLKNKGAVRGTDVKDLVELVGGAEPGDQIQVKSFDGYSDRFQYDTIYNPAPGQGKVVIAWYTKNAGDGAPLYTDGAYVPTFDAGMQLVFMVETTNGAGLHVFGHEDMRTYLPEENWHYFVDGVIQYPSANGLSLKWINQVNIYSQASEAWSIDVTGAVTTTVGQTWFENALACHEVVEWTDGGGNVWSGLPLWWLVGLADDDNVHGIGSFNDALAEAGYDIEVEASDGYTRTFRSEDIARSSDYIVANKVNGAPLSDDHFPLRLVGDALTSGSQRVGKIARINLLNIPEIETWTLELSGATDYVMTQAEFVSAVLCPGHGVEYTDADGTWKGLPLWLLVGWVDDDNAHGADAFNDELAALGYQVRVIASDGYSRTFEIADVARNDDIIVANTLDGQPLPEARYPLRLMGSALTSGSQRVGKIVRIELLDLPTPPPDWELDLTGAITTTLSAEDFIAMATAHPAQWEDNTGNLYNGVALWRLAGMVDDDDSDAFSDVLATLGYDIRAIASDGYSRTVTSALAARSDDIIVANLMNGQPLPENRYPLRVVGAGLSSGQMVSQVVEIRLENLPQPQRIYLPLVAKQ